MPNFDVLTIGSATRDLFLESRQFRILKDPTFSTGEAECFALGTKVEIPTIVDETGGGATNAAVSCARLGLRTAAAIRVGTDHRGAAIADEVRSEGVRVFPTRDHRHRTAISVLLLTGRGERTVLVHRGASSHIQPSDLPAVRARWYYATSVAGSRATVAAVYARARSRGGAFAWNPGSEELRWGLRGVARYLRGTTIILNETEAATLTRERNAKQALRSLLAAGAARAVITLGKDGALAAEGARTFHAGTHRIAVIDTTGAGDAFGSAFVAAHAKGWNLTRALQLATANSESVIRHVGAKPGLRRNLPPARERVRVRPA